MTNTPIIDIDINSSEFDSFLQKWDEYQDSLKSMPQAFQALNKRVAEFQKLQMAAGVSAGASLEAALKMEGAMKKVANQQERGAAAVKKSAISFKSMAADTLKIGKGVVSITGMLAKWGGFVGALGLGAGFFGLDALASSAMNQQRSARSLGVTIGQANAMKTNMGNLFNTNSVMMTVANASQIAADYGNLAGTGMSYAQAAKMGPFAATLALAASARQAYKQNPNLAIARFGQIFSPSEMRTMAATSDQQFKAAEASARNDSTSLGFSNSVANQWVILSKQLMRAGQEIEATLITGLAPLAPQLAALSQAFNQLLKMGIRDLSGEIDKSAVYLKEFAAFLGSPQFMGDLRTFGAAMSQLGGEVVNALRYFNLIPQATPSFSALSAAANNRTPGALPNANARAFWLETHGPQYSASNISAVNSAAAKKFGVPVGLLNRISLQESGYGKYLRSSKGALGVDQLMPATAATLHVGDTWNVQDNIYGAAQYLRVLYDHYGSWSKAVAAYNMGPTNLDKDISAHGKNWLRFAPHETQGYVANVAGAGSSKLNSTLEKILAAAQAKQASSYKYLTVAPYPGASIAVSANAIAAGY